MSIMKNAVSNVVGVILMVAVTVLISAVVAAMVFGFTNTRNPHFVAFSLTKSGEEFSLTLRGGETHAIDECKVLKNSEIIGIFQRGDIGKILSFQAVQGDRVIVTCRFLDQSESIVFEHTI